MDSQILNDFKRLVNLPVRENILGSKFTTFSIGGPLQYVLEVENREQLRTALLLLQQNNQSYKVIGAGSNLLISDDGLKGWFIILGRGFKYVNFENNNTVRVGAAQSLMSLSKTVSDLGRAGLEFAGGIPASVGGAVVMNAGAHHGEMSQLLDSITVISQDGEFLEITKDELKPSYRKGGVPSDCIVIEAILSLAVSTTDKTSALRAEHLEYRKRTQPLQAASAGSVFRNPSADKTAGFLIDQCGMKGKTVGGAMISELHANWIINPKKNGRAEEVKCLISECQKAVLDRFSITITPEIVCWD